MASTGATSRDQSARSTGISGTARRLTSETNTVVRVNVRRLVPTVRQSMRAPPIRAHGWVEMRRDHAIDSYGGRETSSGRSRTWSQTGLWRLRRRSGRRQRTGHVKQSALSYRVRLGHGDAVAVSSSS
jgi:hypothetical protein